MITDYTQKELQHVVRVHTALKDDYKKLHTSWKLTKNPTKKLALENRLRVKANRLAALSDEIRQLSVNDSVIEPEAQEDAVVEDYMPVVMELSTKNASLQILLAIIGAAALALIVQYLITQL